MTVKYAILAFPQFDTPSHVDAVRRRFDPLAHVLDAHVTLVFPFEDSAGLVLAHQAASAATSRTAPFAIMLSPPSVEEERYLFLRVTDDRHHVAALHAALYTGALARHRSIARQYDPHVTIGRLGSQAELTRAAREADRLLPAPPAARIDSLAIFRLDQDAVGAIECTIPLGPVSRAARLSRTAPNER